MLRFLLFRASLFVLGRLPLPVAYRLAQLAADLVYASNRNIRKNVLDNLRHVATAGIGHANIESAARQIIRNVGLYYADLAQMDRMDVYEFGHRRFRYFGFDEHFIPAVEAGRGVVILSAHLGNPELGVQGLIPLGHKVVALTEPLEPPSLSRLLDRLRSRAGHTFLPVGIPSVKRVMQTLRKGGVVTLMGDRDIRGPKDLFPFFDKEALMPTGPIEVALRAGAAIIPAFSARRGLYIIEAYLEEPLTLAHTGDFHADVRAGTMQFLKRLENRLRAEPAQWLVLERIWENRGEGPAQTRAKSASRRRGDG